MFPGANLNCDRDRSRDPWIARSVCGDTVQNEINRTSRSIDTAFETLLFECRTARKRIYD